MNKVPNKKNTDGLDSVLSSLYALHRFGIKPGLERTLFLLEKANNPQHNFKAVHIAGTNGKGSVSSLIASILQEAGFKTGLYTSPHLLKFNERIRINGKMIDDEELAVLASKYLEIAKGTESTFFEITTAIAFEFFSKNNIDIAIIETGMGGRFDSTNVIEPLLSIITNVTLDHTEYLGNSIEEIAFEKAGIIKAGIPVFCGKMYQAALNVIQQKASELHSILTNSTDIYQISEIGEYKELKRKIKLSSTFGELSFDYPLPGKHQLDNLVLAVSAINELRNEFKITDNSIVKGIANVLRNTGLRGRIELLRAEPPVILDTSHNPDGITALVETITEAYPERNFTVVFAAMKDKDIAQMLEILNPVAKGYVFAELQNERAEQVDNYHKAAGLYDMKYKNMPAEEAVEHAFNSSDAVIITGTFYLAEQVLKYIENKSINK